MTSWEFPVTGPVEARIQLAAGTVTVTAGPAGRATVSLAPEHPGARGADTLIDQTQVSFEDGQLSVIVPERIRLLGGTALHAEVALPEGSGVSAKTASADLRCTGELGALSVYAASGDVRAERVGGPADIATASGDVQLKSVARDAQIRTASGGVRVERAAGDVTMKTASGDLMIGLAGGSAAIKTASGDIRVDGIAAGRGDFTTVSGDITVAVPPGVGVYLDLSSVTGQVSSDFEPGPAGGEAALTMKCSSVSGDVRVRRATQSVLR
jgi:Putative adhesin